MATERFTPPAADHGIIEKPASSPGRAPNMGGYDEAYIGFDWRDYREELDWFDDTHLNIAYNVVDRHADSSLKNKVALYWQGGDGSREEYTFLQLSRLSNKFGNALLNIGVQAGERVFIFAPRLPELYIAFLGILKIGAIATTVFSAFGPEAMLDRLLDAEATLVITTPELKGRIAETQEAMPSLRVMVLDGRGGGALENAELSYTAEMEAAPEQLEVARTAVTDHAFLLYTSGTTGKPKGILHTHGALLQQHLTAKWVLDLKEDDVYWCTADPGWVTGVSYGMLAPWSNGVSQIVYEGRFDPEQWYRVIEERRVTVWYTAPTAIRMLMKEGDELPARFDLSSLRHMCSVGEPLNPEAIRWGLKAFGLPFHDNWWQTETGAILVSNYPSMPIRVGSMGKPFPGVTAGIVDDNGRELPAGVPGNLGIKPGWPAMFAGIWKNEEKYKSCFVGDWYLSGDKAYEDSDGYFWFIGRADDVIMTAGERVGPFEVESALLEHPAIAEAGVIGKPDPLRGEIIKAFIILTGATKPSEELQEHIRRFVKKRLAGHAYPREMEFVETLPKTRSGKIMRRVLKAREMGLPVGDTSALEED